MGDPAQSPTTMLTTAPTLETPRLRLRAHRPDDHAICTQIWSDPQVTRFIGGHPLNAEDAWKRLLQYAGMWILLGYGYWAIEDKRSGDYVGDVGFADLKRELVPALDGMLECGWALASAAHGHGYASEAVAAINAWAQVNFPTRKIACIISPDNLASLRVAEKMGFHAWQTTTYHGSPIVAFIR